MRRYGLVFPAEVQQRLDVLDSVRGRLIDLAIEPPVRAAVGWLADWVERAAPDDASPEERRARPKLPGLYQVTRDLYLEPANRLESQHPSAPSREDPFLVLIHGTASHTENSFAGLRATAEWQQLIEERYQNRVLALEHKTLARSPIDNALELARMLPAGANLDLLSHSRGGLVAELLSMAVTGHRDFETFARAGRDPADLVALEELFDIVAEQGFRVGRFVRVGCPARGTVLASRRLDQYAKWLLNALSLIPGVGQYGVMSVLKSLILTFLDQRTDASVVPGLEAQMPESPFIRFINSYSPSAGRRARGHRGRRAGQGHQGPREGVRRRSLLPVRTTTSSWTPAPCTRASRASAATTPSTRAQRRPTSLISQKGPAAPESAPGCSTRIRPTNPGASCPSTARPSS